MLVDGRSILAGTMVQTDICIIGAGPAGLSLANELLHHNVDVVMLESGGIEAGSQDRLRLEHTESPLEPVVNSRWEQLGGTANIWNTYIDRTKPAARYLPLDEIDFEQRAWLPYSGWPFGRSTLDPFYERAYRLCCRGSDLHALSSHTGIRRAPLHFQDGTVTTTVEDFGRGDVFATHIPALLKHSRKVTVYTKSTVTAIAVHELGASIDHVIVQPSPHRSFKVIAKVYVLACGGIENARLLLHSNQVHKSGLGNAHDLVGRFFMDHHRINGGHLIPFDQMLFNRASLYDLWSSGSRYIMGKLTLAPHVMQEERILNSSTLLWPRPSQRDEQAVEGLKVLGRSLKRREFDRSMVGRLAHVLGGHRYLFGTGLRLMIYQRQLHPAISRGGWSYLPHPHKRFASFEIIHQVEQAPNPSNRVVLGTGKDAFGLPRAQVHACWSAIDIATIRRVRQILTDQFEKNGIGRVVWNDAQPEMDLHDGVAGIHHHMGTTRMHIDPRQGVVNANSQMHGVSNLFVTGSSVFPTGGYANPTLTIVALAIRLADTLVKEVKTCAGG